MASVVRGPPLRRPSCCLKYLHQPATRSFSTTRSQSAQSPSIAAEAIKNMPKQLSMSSRMKKLRKSEIPSDIGLIPNTYVRSCGNMPSWFSTPMLRAQLEWLYIRQGFKDFTSGVLQFRWYRGKDPMTGRRKKLPLKLRERATAIRDLHQQLYGALAAGDRKTIEKIACSGLANQQLGRLERARISGAPPATWTGTYSGWTMPTRLYWTLQSIIPSYFKSIHVLSDRAIQIPVGQGFMLRQVVARVDSRQTLNKNDGSDPVTKKMREYIVIQNTIVDDEVQEWKIWGTVNPTSTEEALEIIKSSKEESGGSLVERMRSMYPGGFSGGLPG